MSFILLFLTESGKSPAGLRISVLTQIAALLLPLPDFHQNKISQLPIRRLRIMHAIHRRKSGATQIRIAVDIFGMKRQIKSAVEALDHRIFHLIAYFASFASSTGLTERK